MFSEKNAKERGLQPVLDGEMVMLLSRNEVSRANGERVKRVEMVINFTDRRPQERYNSHASRPLEYWSVLPFVIATGEIFSPCI